MASAFTWAGKSEKVRHHTRETADSCHDKCWSARSYQRIRATPLERRSVLESSSPLGLTPGLWPFTWSMSLTRHELILVWIRRHGQFEFMQDFYARHVLLLLLASLATASGVLCVDRPISYSNVCADGVLNGTCMCLHARCQNLKRNATICRILAAKLQPGDEAKEHCDQLCNLLAPIVAAVCILSSATRPLFRCAPDVRR